MEEMEIDPMRRMLMLMDPGPDPGRLTLTLMTIGYSYPYHYPGPYLAEFLIIYIFMFVHGNIKHIHDGLRVKLKL